MNINKRVHARMLNKTSNRKYAPTAEQSQRQNFNPSNLLNLRRWQSRPYAPPAVPETF